MNSKTSASSPAGTNPGTASLGSDRATLCPRDELAPGEVKRFNVRSRQIALARIGDEFFAIDDICSHGHFSLSEGELDEFDCTLECPKHGSLFDLRTGQPETLPATEPVAVYPVQVQNGEVQVELPANQPAEQPAP